MKTTAYFFILILSSMLWISCSEEQNQKSNSENCLNKDFLQNIKTVSPKKENIKNEITLSGVVTANPEKVIHFNNLVDGIIVNTYFTLGDYVKKGQLLALVKSPELTRWTAQKKILNAQLNVAQNEYSVEKKLFDAGISSYNQLHKTESILHELTAELEEIAANLELYNASTATGVFRIEAHKSGYITEKNISSGVHVSAYGASLFTISELDEIWVEVNIYASHLKDVYEGMAVDIHSLANPEIQYQGTLNSISQIFDSQSHVVKGRVYLTNENLNLRPGMYVDVHLKNEMEERVTSLPTEALIFDNNQNHIVLLRDSCRMEIMSVEQIGQHNGSSYIRNDLKNDAQIIIQNQLLIYENLKNTNALPAS